MKISEFVDEMLDVVGKVLDGGKGFFIPTTVEYSLLTYSEDFPVNTAFSSSEASVNHLEYLERKIESEEGIFFQDLKEDVQNFKTSDIVGADIRRIEISGKTRFNLKEKDMYIDCSSKGLYADPDYKEVLSPQQVRDSLPLSNSFYISIFHDGLKSENQHVEISDPAYYKVVFWTWTNMWFEDTEIGLTNRNRLRNFLRKMYENFDVVFTSHIADRYSEEQLNDIVFGEG
ncbi:hypothetical protein MettiDRAFT_0978 [Methanolobus tindarius DSM 2278]|uniref:Uncharacterized protein n=1 Tax=Methanolobus tindarius DSM 2278 TaxID=1090322 RepID=W9DVY0_METTI|nr:hypothetical protein [Methanolobus tindarius]ETA67551.1 hypothetical protein MettiDRAFT_0978 [Methanolobus tindarius DSM 2278]